MKPLRISIQAFGPYAGLQELDFGDLAGHDFFLIHGPTGAGKTSILDAISYALYGETSGGLREAKDMRSHFADPNTLTRVAFEFQLGGKTYRVERTPEQPVPKQRGGGFKKLTYTANLWELKQNHLVPIATEKPSAVDTRVIELMGFKAGQFRQVVLLPQGQFQEFLLASSLERQSILQVLFQTSRYARITEALATETQNLKDGIRTIQAEIRQLLDQAEVKDREALEIKLETARIALTTLQLDQKRASDAFAVASSALQEGHRVAALVRERDQAQEQLEQLRTRKPRVEALRTELERARRADRVMPFATRLQESEATLAHLQQEEDSLLSIHQAKAQDLAAAQARLDQADRQEFQRDNLRRTILRLKELEPQLKQMEESREIMRESARERLGLEADIQRQRKRSELIGQSLSNLMTSRQELQDKGSRVEALEHQLYQDRKQRLIREETDKIEGEFRSADDNFRTSDETRRQYQEERDLARQHLQVIQKRWNEGQAAILAHSLKHGGPCPVCGSRIHPHLADPSGTLPSEIELHDAQERAEKAEWNFNQASQAANQKALVLEGLKNKLQVLHDSLGDKVDESLEALLGLEAEHRRELESAQQARRDLPPLEEKIAAQDKERSQVEALIQETQNQCAQAQAREASARGALQVLESNILADLRVPGMLSTRIEQATESLAALEKELQEARATREQAASVALEAKVQLEAHQAHRMEAEVQIGHRQRELDDALAQFKFWQRSDFDRARLDPADQERLEKEIQAHDEALAAAVDRQHRAFTQADGLLDPDLETLQKSMEEAQKNLEERGRMLGKQTSDLDVLTHILEAVIRKQREIADQDRRYASLGRLSKVARGEEGAKVSFERFVQGAILDEVLVLASHRLQSMSRNRYSLRRASGSTDLRKSGGLDLEVQDTHTGRARAASTLSGGEGFQASLALALGLSDVVQRHAGGVRLDTVFVDEGFGSLDQESLDLALRTLDELKQGGRLVGIISHLEEVKQRIPAQLEIIPSPGGSRATFRIG